MVDDDLAWHLQFSGHVLELFDVLPSGKHTQNYGKSQFLMGKSTISSISVAMFSRFLYLYQAGYPWDEDDPIRPTKEVELPDHMLGSMLPE